MSEIKTWINTEFDSDVHLKQSRPIIDHRSSTLLSKIEEQLTHTDSTDAEVNERLFTLLEQAGVEESAET